MRNIDSVVLQYTTNRFLWFILITDKAIQLYKSCYRSRCSLLQFSFIKMFYQSPSDISNPFRLLLKGSKTHLFVKTLMFYEPYIKSYKSFHQCERSQKCEIYRWSLSVLEYMLQAFITQPDLIWTLSLWPLLWNSFSNEPETWEATVSANPCMCSWPHGLLATDSKKPSLNYKHSAL